MSPLNLFIQLADCSACSAVTGAARGIGFELVKLYSADPSNVIIAGVRDTTSPTALLEVAKSSQAKIHLVKIVAGDEEGNKVAAKEVEGLVGRVDVLWANAGELLLSAGGGNVWFRDVFLWLSSWRMRMLTVVLSRYLRNPQTRPPDQPRGHAATLGDQHPRTSLPVPILLSSPPQIDQGGEEVCHHQHPCWVFDRCGTVPLDRLRIVQGGHQLCRDSYSPGTRGKGQDRRGHGSSW